MKYILIFVVQIYAPITSGTAEFNTLEACQTAASLIVSQAKYREKVPVLVCAPKG